MLMKLRVGCRLLLILALTVLPGCQVNLASKDLGTDLVQVLKAVLAQLPQIGLLADSPPVYFHQELSIQDRVWLGGENVLKLGPETNGVLAVYSLKDQVVTLVLIEYPDAQQASAGLQGLEASGNSDVLVAKTQAQRLALVSGSADPAAAEALIDQALK